jgi:hypothetical protein
MQLLSPVKNDVPLSSLLLARQLREDIVGDNNRLKVVLHQVVSPVQRRLLSGKPKLRGNQIIDALRQWQERVPRHYQISRRVEPDVDRLFIEEIRPSASTWVDHSWTEPGDEFGISISRLTFDTRNPASLLTTTPLLVFSMHRLARCAQRVEAVNPDVIFHHMMATLSNQDRWQDDRIPINAGDWVGSTVHAAFDGALGRRVLRVRAIRTFVRRG